MDFLPQWASDLSGWGAFVFLSLTVVYYIMSGRLVTRRELDAANQRADKFLHAWELLVEARRRESEKVDPLVMENARTNIHVLGALQERLANSEAPDSSEATP